MYIKRYLDKYINEAINYFPSILISGARQVGKSTLVLQLSGYSYITLDDTTAFSFAKSDPEGFIKNLNTPVIIDEIQKIPELLSAIKKDIDIDRKNGKFILTGSANILGFKNISETLAGRIAIFELTPFSISEYNKSKNLFDILFNFKALKKIKIKKDNIVSNIISGGYPEVRKIKNEKMRYFWFSSYIRTYIERDIRDIGELRNLDKFINLFNIIAARNGNIMNKTDISRDSGIDIKTLNIYLNLLMDVFQIFELKNFSNNNFGKRFIKSPKLYFKDSGVLSHILGIRNIDNFEKSPYKGMLVETFIFNELYRNMVYYENKLNISYYRTFDKREIDFIIESDDHILAVEVKSSSSLKSSDFKTLREFTDTKSKKELLGIIFYRGDKVFFLKDNLAAIPLALLDS